MHLTRRDERHRRDRVSELRLGGHAEDAAAREEEGCMAVSVVREACRRWDVAAA